MDSNPQPTPALEDRLGAVVGQIKQSLIALPRFRPDDPTLAADFDQIAASLLQIALDISAAAAVDHAAILVAVELAQQRKEHRETMAKLQADQDAAPKPTIPFSLGAG